MTVDTDEMDVFSLFGVVEESEAEQVVELDDPSGWPVPPIPAVHHGRYSDEDWAEVWVRMHDAHYSRLEAERERRASYTTVESVRLLSVERTSTVTVAILEDTSLYAMITERYVVRAVDSAAPEGAEVVSDWVTRRQAIRRAEGMGEVFSGRMENCQLVVRLEDGRAVVNPSAGWWRKHCKT